MMHPPEISVVMGVYNNADSLPAALDSILSQEGVNLEFIVVDDGSTDGSAAVLDAAARRDPRLKIVHKRNEGLTRALIDGCALAVAPWIARQDADDVSLPGRLKAQLERARGKDAPVLVSCRARCLSPEGDLLYVTHPPVEPEAARRHILEAGRTLSAHGSMFFRSDVYRRVGGYRAAFYFAQDLDLSIRLVEQGPVAVLEGIHYAFQFSPRSISGTATCGQADFLRLIQKAQAARRLGHSEQPVLEEAARWTRDGRNRGARSAAAFASLYFMGACLLRSHSTHARRYLGLAVRQHPWSVRAWIRWIQASARGCSA